MPGIPSFSRMYPVETLLHALLLLLILSGTHAAIDLNRDDFQIGDGKSAADVLGGRAAGNSSTSTEVQQLRSNRSTGAASRCKKLCNQCIITWRAAKGACKACVDCECGGEHPYGEPSVCVSSTNLQRSLMSDPHPPFSLPLFSHVSSTASPDFSPTLL
jgi:hypothetical protein